MVLFPFHRGLNLLRLLGTKHWLLDIQRAYGWRSCAFLLKPVCVLRCPLELKLYLLFDHVFSPLQDFTGKWHIHYPIVMKICHLNPTGLFYPKTPNKYCYGLHVNAWQCLAWSGILTVYNYALFLIYRLCGNLLGLQKIKGNS